MPHPTADSSWFTFETPPTEGLRVFSHSGAEEIHRPCEFEIELVHESADFSDPLGQPACLSVADKSGGAHLVHGLIRHFSQLHTSNLHTDYRCLLVPRLWFPGLTQAHRIFQNLNVLQIIERILKEQNFTADSCAFKCFFDHAPPRALRAVRRGGPNFISRLYEEEGAYNPTLSARTEQDLAENYRPASEWPWREVRPEVAEAMQGTKQDPFSALSRPYKLVPADAAQ
jgi:type VI secretion system secreted protein VgrG